MPAFEHDREPPADPAEIEREVREAGEPWVTMLDEGRLDDAAAWALSRFEVEPTGQNPTVDRWDEIYIQLTPEGESNEVTIIDRSHAAIWTAAILDGPPTWSIYELGRDVDAIVEIDSPGGGGE